MRLTEWPAYTRLNLDVVAAEGHELVLRDGRRVLDLYGGHCVNTLGAGDRTLGDVIGREWRRVSFATNLLDHAARAEFLAAFEPTLPPGEWTVFASNSGAEANENALKAALSATGRPGVLCFGGAFHGRTAAAAAVSEGAGSGFPRAPFEVVRVPFGDAEAAARAIDRSIGAVIVEPIQSLAGVVDPPPGFLESLRAACDASGALLVFDEVQTGNGRLGTPWASQHFGVVPDLFTTAKGAAGGVPIGLTVATTEWAARVPRGIFGSTFGGGPMAFAAAAEVARRIATPGFLTNVQAAGRALGRAAARGPVTRVRGTGLLLGLELAPGLKAADVRDLLLARGVLVGTSSDPRVVRLSPGLTLRIEDADRLATAFQSISPADLRPDSHTEPLCSEVTS